jgi:hypothetical protein
MSIDLQGMIDADSAQAIARRRDASDLAMYAKPEGGLRATFQHMLAWIGAVAIAESAIVGACVAGSIRQDHAWLPILLGGLACSCVMYRLATCYLIEQEMSPEDRRRRDELRKGCKERTGAPSEALMQAVLRPFPGTAKAAESSDPKR